MPRGDPIIFAGTKLGYLVCIKIGLQPIVFGAHNDKPKMQHKPVEVSPVISNLIKVDNVENLFWSISETGMIRQWEVLP